MVEIIKKELLALERQHNIHVLYACESGSRAWGFPSPDSDFDVRFIYSRKLNDYLSIKDLKDVLNLPVNEVLDIGGWDIKKGLKLFLKSNSPLYEWIQSPIIYKDDAGFVDKLRSLMPVYYSLRAGGNHYLSITINTIADDLKGEKIKLKRYFYAIRSALACKWIIDIKTVPPMELNKLRTTVLEDSFQLSVDELLKLKAISDEKTLISHNTIVDKWLEETVSMCKLKLQDIQPDHNSYEELDVIFRKYILP